MRTSQDSVVAEQDVTSVVTYKMALQRQELEDAYTLVWNNYVDVGLQEDNHVGIRFTKYHLLPQTKVFVAKVQDPVASHVSDEKNCLEKIVGTISLVFDSPMGLPMEEFCADEIAALRQQGRRPAEVIAFALHPDYSSFKEFLPLFKLSLQFALHCGVTDLCCSVTSRHIRFYRKVMLFEPMGGLVSYSAAHKLKVQGHRLNLTYAAFRAKQVYTSLKSDTDLYTFFFADKYREQKDDRKPLSGDIIKYFSTEKTNFISTLNEKDLNVLRTEYLKIGDRIPF